MLLWLAVFLGLMVLYSMLSWITKLASSAGLSPRDSIPATPSDICRNVAISATEQMLGQRPETIDNDVIDAVARYEERIAWRREG